MSNGEKTIERLNRFIDAILAIVATIMVLELPLPEASANSFKELLPFFAGIGIFLVSFLLVIHFYLVNMRYFNVIKKISGQALLMLVIWLALLTLLPFFTRWMIDDHSNRTAIVNFAILWALLIISHSVLVDLVIHDNFNRIDVIKQTKENQNSEFGLAMMFIFMNSIRSRISIGISFLLLIVAVIKPDIAYFLFLLSPIPLILNDTIDDQERFSKDNWTPKERQEMIRQLRYHTAPREERLKMRQEDWKRIAKQNKIDINDKAGLRRAAILEHQQRDQQWSKQRKNNHRK